MSRLVKLINKLNVISKKANKLHWKNRHYDSKIDKEIQWICNIQIILKKKNKVGFALPDFKAYYKAVLINSMEMNKDK